MTSAWDDIRQAIATKIAASSGCTTAGLRAADVDTDDPITPPHIRVLQPGYTLNWQSGVKESFTLDVPFELVVEQPGGRKRSDPKAATIARALQVEWQSGYKLTSLDLGLVSITDARLTSMTPGLTEYADQGYDGYRGVITVDVEESVTRSA